ncbi:MAG: Tat pathway signal protein [Deltaproteobacteria bacterium RBG_13_49_15]|nr:MAG: Tat pathway signal protein [Deltaproteobacteria bacterium RBG_13_49_15]
MDSKTAPKSEDRRQFLIRTVKAALSIAGAGAIGYGFHKHRRTSSSFEVKSLIGFPDFSIPGLEGRMCVAKDPDRINALKRALNAMGGIEAWIREGDRVLLKVNAAFATPPNLSATTHPDLVYELASLCRKAGAKKVIVTDNPINDPLSCFSLTGIAKAALSAGAEVVIPKEHYFKPMTLSGGKLIREWPVLYEPFAGINKVIGVAPVKDHQRSGASMSMKNWYGILGGRRNIFHQNIHDIIKELAILVKPTLVILDGTFTMITNGPTGGSLSDLKKTNRLVVSSDQVAADSFGATLLGKDPGDLPFIAKAEAAGAGRSDYRSLEFKMI